jgi:hypothetical protein
MYLVMILEAAHEDLRNIVACISDENPDSAETLGRELLDQAMGLERGCMSFLTDLPRKKMA